MQLFNQPRTHEHCQTMATGDWNMGTKIEMEPLSCCEDSANNVGTSRLNIRSHTRSQSWTNPPVGQANFTSSLTSIYSVSPLATVFREFFMRSGGQSNHTPNRRENHLNRTFSETSLPRQQVIHSRGNTPPPQEHRTLEGASISEDLPGRTNEEVIQDNVEQPTIGVEISEGVRWMERNAVFIVIVLIKFSFYHRAGERIDYSDAIRCDDRNYTATCYTENVPSTGFCRIFATLTVRLSVERSLYERLCTILVFHVRNLKSHKSQPLLCFCKTLQ